MPQKYKDKRTAKFAAGDRVKEFQAIERQAYKRLEILEAAPNKEALMALPSNRFEALGGDRKGQYSIRINELEELGISASELARSLHIPTNRITQILKGQRGITADTALRLGRWFGTGAELWLNLQKAYELRLAEELAGEEIQKTIQLRSSNNQQLVQV